MLYNKNIKILKEGKSGNYLNKTINMCTFIKMEYLVANALVQLYETKQINKISLKNIREYGIKVEEKLNENSRAILLYSSNYTKEFLQDYSDYFELLNDDICIKSGVTVEEIREHILSYISFDILFALFDEVALCTLMQPN